MFILIINEYLQHCFVQLIYVYLVEQHVSEVQKKIEAHTRSLCAI